MFEHESLRLNIFSTVIEIDAFISSNLKEIGFPSLELNFYIIIKLSKRMKTIEIECTLKFNYPQQGTDNYLNDNDYE